MLNEQTKTNTVRIRKTLRKCMQPMSNQNPNKM